MLGDLSKKLLPYNTKVATQKYTRVIKYYTQAQGKKYQKELVPCNTKVATPKYTKVVTWYA